jgi:signal transduction histidine kinase
MTFDYLSDFMDTTNFGLGFYNPENNSIDFPALFEKRNPLPPFRVPLTNTTSCAAWCFTNQKEIFSNNFLNEYSEYISELLIHTSQKPQSLIYLPLTADNKRIGVVTVQSYNSDAYSLQDFNILQTVASYITIALDNANMYKALQHNNETLIKQTEILNETNTRLEEHQQFIEEQAEELKVSNDHLTNQKLKIEEQAKNLSLLNATKDKFFSIIAHDLRNPFNTVIGFSDILLQNFRKYPEDKIEKFLGYIHSSSIIGNDLLSNLLTWSRSQSGSITFKPEKLELTTIVQESLNLLEANAHQKGITILKSFPNEIFCSFDENMIKTVIRNLVSNAIKFTSHKGEINITIEKKGDVITISVRDNGVGIAKEHQERLFQADSNVSTKGTSNESGTGLGLILCKEFVEKHGGRIWVESEEGKGSAFKFTFPS